MNSIGNGYGSWRDRGGIEQHVWFGLAVGYATKQGYPGEYASINTFGEGNGYGRGYGVGSPTIQDRIKLNLEEGSCIITPYELLIPKAHT